MVAKLHKLAAGDGYLYLIRQTAAGDSSERGFASLESYYSEKGEAPGKWWGHGLAALEIAPGDRVTEQQMKNLFGAGVHPDAEKIREQRQQQGHSHPVSEAATRLGQKFPVYQGSNEWRARLGQAYGEWNVAAGLPSDWPVPAPVREEIRTSAAGAMFVEQYERPPADVRELTGFVARQSRPRSTAVAGYDHTFTPVKSVSALWAVAPLPVAEVIAAAHDAAVEATMRKLQDEYAYTRVGARGVAQVDTVGLVAVSFTHRDSRAGEPNLHTHVAVSNKIQTLDGRWLALDGRVWHRVAQAMSDWYDTHLEAELTERLGVQFAQRSLEPGKRPIREITGVEPGLVERWSSRRKQILTRREELTGDFVTAHGRAPTAVEAVRLSATATLDTRPGKHDPRSYAEQRATWWQQAEAAVGADRIHDMLRRTVRNTAAALVFTRVTDELTRQLAAAVIEDVSDARATWTSIQVLGSASRFARVAGVRPAAVDQLIHGVVEEVMRADTLVPIGAESHPSQVDKHLDQVLPNELRRRDGSSVFRVHAAQLYTSSDVLAAERRILAAAGRTGSRTVSDRDIAIATLEWSANHGGAQLNHGQTVMVQQAAQSGRRLQLILAPAGTGKTTTAGVLASAWRHSGGTVLGLAPRSTASQELREALDHVTGGVDADTLDKLVWSVRHQRPNAWPEWIHRIGPRTLAIVDEAALAGTRTLDSGLQFLLDRGATVRLMGDTRQRSSVAAGGILRDIEHTHGALTLTEVVRFTDRVEGSASLALRAGDPLALGFYLDRGRVHAVTPDTAAESVYRAWVADRAAGADSIMLAPTNVLVRDLNARARADRLAVAEPNAARLADGGEVTVGNGETLSAGDTVISGRNERVLGLPNGNYVRNGYRWTVDTVHPDGAITVTQLGYVSVTITLPASYVHEDVRLGYATTLDSAQGITVGSSRGNTPGTAHLVVTSTMDGGGLYVGMTRAVTANHAHVITGTDGDAHALTHPDALSPASAAETLAAVIARDNAQRSAHTATTEAADPIRRLGVDADAYLQSLRVGAEAFLGPDRLAALIAAAEQAVPGVTDAPAWDTLRGHLATVALTGTDPIPVLAGAAASRELSTARDIAAVLDWRIDPSGRHSLPAGPLPWLPAIPAPLHTTADWAPALQLLEQRVTQDAATIRAFVASWTPAAAPAWALPYLDNTALLSDLAVWRAYNQTPDHDPAPAGDRPQLIALQRRHGELVIRAHQHTGLASDGANRWCSQLDAAGRQLRQDPDWPLIAARLTRMDAAGIAVADLLAAAAAGSPLPDEKPAAALWFRLVPHLGDDLLTITDNTGSVRIRPYWTEEIHAAIGDTIAGRITADRLWPVIVARVDTAARAGSDSSTLIRDAAALLAGETGHLAPDQLAPALLWQLNLFADDTPLDLHPDQLPVDPLDLEQAPPHDVDQPGREASADAASVIVAEPRLDDEADRSLLAVEPPYDPDLDDQAPDHNDDHDSHALGDAGRRDLEYLPVGFCSEPYPDLLPEDRVAALTHDLLAAEQTVAELAAATRIGAGQHASAAWESHLRDLAHRADDLRPYTVARDAAAADLDTAQRAAEHAHDNLAALERQLATAAAGGDTRTVDISSPAVDVHRVFAAAADHDTLDAQTHLAAADRDLAEAAGGRPVVTRDQVDDLHRMARDLDDADLSAARRRVQQLRDQLWRAERIHEQPAIARGIDADAVVYTGSARDSTQIINRPRTVPLAGQDDLLRRLQNLQPPADRTPPAGRDYGPIDSGSPSQDGPAR